MSRQHTCLEKLWYPSLRVARAAAKRHGRRHRVKLRVYTCPYCLGWHLTTQPRVASVMAA